MRRRFASAKERDFARQWADSLKFDRMVQAETATKDDALQPSFRRYLQQKHRVISEREWRHHNNRFLRLSDPDNQSIYYEQSTRADKAMRAAESNAAEALASMPVGEDWQTEFMNLRQRVWGPPEFGGIDDTVPDDVVIEHRGLSMRQIFPSHYY